MFIIPAHLLAAEVTLAWDPNDPTPDGYEVFQRLDGESYNYSQPAWPTDGQDHTETTCIITNLADDTTYHFVVRAYVGSDISGDSNEISHHTPASAPDTYTISATAGAHGAISPNSTITLNAGDDQTYTIAPDAGYHVADVLVDGQSQGAVSSYTFSNVSANHSISVTFSANIFTVTASAGTHGSITPSGSVGVALGGNQSYTITPDAGYHVSDVLVDGQSQGAVTSYTFNNVSANHSISATFSANSFTVTASAGTHGSITPSGSINVTLGASQSYNITPDAGYHVSDVLVDGQSQGVVTSYTFSNVSANHSIEASFTLNNMAPVADAGPDQSVEETGVVLLSGMNSFDLDDGIASFAWQQIEGPAVVLSGRSEAEITFTAPETGPEGLALVFELQVTDHAGTAATDTCIVNVVWVNAPPTAQAGADQIVEEGRMVTLDGANSVDPDQDITTYRWQQISGPVVELSDPAAIAPTFIAPNVGLQDASLEFQLTVVDSGGLQDTDSTLVSVTWINTPPLADAGPDQELFEGAEGVLDGSNSRDGDDGITAYKWTQTDGTPVLLSDATAINPTFTTPNVDLQGMTLTFQLTVTDHGGLQHQDTCNVNVLWENMAPQALAGPDQTVDEGNLVRLDGSSSTDADDGIAIYQWSQTGGTAVSLSDPQAVAPTFTAPDVDIDGAALLFTLTVVDSGGLKTEDSCVVNVTWQNQPPVAQAGPDGQVYFEDMVTLDGSTSHDSDDGIVSYRWRQVSGNPVSLEDPVSQITSFQAPAVDAETVLAFELSVADLGGLQSTDTCRIVVQPPAVQTDNTPPEIQLVEPSSKSVFVFTNKVTLRGTAWDNRQVDRVEWWNSRGYGGVAQGTGNWEIVDLPLSRWKNIITLTAYDSAGNSSSVQVKVYYLKKWWR